MNGASSAGIAWDMTPSYVPAAVEDLLSGSHALDKAFLENPAVSRQREDTIVRADDTDPPVFRLVRGVAYRACILPNGRRAILDVLVPGDIGGIQHAIIGHPHQQIVAAGLVSYRMMTGAKLRELMRDPAVATKVLALMAEARARVDRHVAALCRLGARERLGALLLDIHDRLRRRDLINRPTFNLPLTQEQIADHLGLTMVHVNRTLRHLREENIAVIERQVVIIMDIERLRQIVRGLPPLHDAAEHALRTNGADNEAADSLV